MHGFVRIGAILAMIAVILGAFGAHALKAKLNPDMLEIYKTGAQYHLIHALGLILIGVIAERNPVPRGAVWAGCLLVAGIILFSGSLYLLSTTGIKAFGAITPLGGVAFISGWGCLAFSAKGVGCRV